MTHETVPSAEGPRELLSAVGDLTRRVRIAQRGSWFPLVVFAAVNVVAIPLYRFGPHNRGRCEVGPHGTTVCAAINPAVLAYWPIALVVAWVVIAGFYVRQSRQRGVGTRVRPYVVVGVVIAALLAAASLWRAAHPQLPPTGLQILGVDRARSFYGVATPAAAIGLALLILAWMERNVALVAFGVVYLAVVVTLDAEPIHSSSPWYFLPSLLISAGLLLAGSVYFATTRPPNERQTP